MDAGMQQWSESNSRFFIEYGDALVPEREMQLRALAALVPPRDGSFHVVELACGAGRLAETLLTRFPDATVHGYDGSHEMLRAAGERLARFGARFQPHLFDLADDGWRTPPAVPLHAILSSLAIHHLDGAQKRALYADLYRMLAPGGVLLLADLVQPVLPGAQEIAAAAWDDAVRENSGGEIWQRFEEEEWNYFRFPDPMDQPSPLAAQLRWLEEAGFARVDVVWMRAGHAIWGAQKAVP